MELTVDCLRDAKLANVERLALSLGVTLPRMPRRSPGYFRELVRSTMFALRRDAAAARREREPRARAS
jgi:hypothetical protein